MNKNSWIFSATGANGYFISRFEQFILDDGIVDLCFEAVEEAVLADGLIGFRSFDHSFVVFAYFTLKFGHSW